MVKKYITYFGNTSTVWTVEGVEFVAVFGPPLVVPHPLVAFSASKYRMLNVEQQKLLLTDRYDNFDRPDGPDRTFLLSNS